MNRTVKKMKLEGSSSNSSRKSTGYSMIHSGHYMTSCLHDNDDNDDDTVEMPIASPDATNNEVTMAAAAELEASSSKSASTTALSSSSSPSVVAAVNVDSSSASGGGANSAASSSVVGASSHGSSGDGVPMTPPSVSVASGSPGPVMFKKSRLALFSSTNGHKSRSMMPKSAAGGGSEERTSSEGAGSGSGGVATVDDSSVRNIVGGPEAVSAVELMNAVKNEQIALSRGQTAALILPGGDVNMQDAMANARKNLFVLLCAQQGSISGGLTLDKTNKSLMKLIFYIKTAYSNNLTSPKWKNFKGFKLQVTEKIRINNVIWRSWFEQFGFKDSSKRKRRLVCQFSIGMGDETTMSTANTSSSAAPASVAPPPTPKMSDRENKFWKARLESITNEYKKWRELSRKQIKATTMNADGTPATTTTTTSKPIAIPSKSSSSSKNDSTVKSNSYQSDKSIMISQLATSSSTCLDESSSLFSSSATATTTASSLAAAAPSITVSAAAPSVTTLPSTASVFNNSAATTPVSAQIGLAAPMPTGNNMSSGYYYGSQGFELNNSSSSANCPPDQLAIQTTGSYQSYGQPSTSAASYSGNSYASSSNSLNPYAISAMAGGGPPINTNSPNFSSGMTNSISTAPSHYHHSPIASKQMPYNNRCRSPSPGLFQDFDLYSFSSDTLFSTYLVEDTKDPVFGTNPDFFQPDLMHLYPNFDFFELCDNDFMSSATTSAAATAAKSENKSSSPVVASHHLQNYSASQSTATAAAAAAAAAANQQQQHYGRSQSSNFEQTTHIQNLNSTTSQSAPNSADTATSSAQQDARKYSLSSVDYSNNNGLSNFDTLVHVATAAQNVQNHKQQPSPDVLQYNTNRSLNSTSASNTNNNNNNNNNNTAAVSSNNSSNSANTIRNLLAMSNTTNNSATNSNASTAPTVSPKLPSSSMRSSMLSSKLQQHQHHQSNAIQTSSKSTPTINGGLNQPPMLNNPVVSSLSQILEKSNTAATAAAMMMNNKSKSVALNEGGNSQTISSLLAALSSASSNISSSNPVASSSSTSGDPSMDNPSSGHKGKRGRKGLDPLKLSPSNSVNSVVVSAAAPIKSKANYNSKKDMKYTLTDPIDDNNLEVKQQQQQQQQQQMALGNNNPYQSAPIYDLMNNNPSNNSNNYNSRHYHHGPQQHHHQNGGMNNTEAVHSINSTPTNSPPSSQNNNYNPHGYMTLVAPPPPPPPPPPQQAYESEYMMAAKNNAAATSSSSSRHHLLASSSSSASSSPPNDTAAAAAVATYSALNPIASGLNGVVAASGLSAAPPGSVLNRMNRSSSVTSVNTLTDANLSNAEQKRRCNIQHGFDRLQMLVPSLLDGKNAKVSKAVMLQKTSEYIKELQTARENRMGDLAGYKRELDELSDKIVECQSQLPANGVSVASGKLNRTERYEQKFNAYIKERTLDNWRFYIFSLILRPLFDSFLGTVTMSSKEDMQRTFEEWTAKSCNLTQLRPIASTALRQLVKSTSILTDSSRLPEECLAAVLAKI